MVNQGAIVWILWSKIFENWSDLQQLKKTMIKENLKFFYLNAINQVDSFLKNY